MVNFLDDSDEFGVTHDKAVPLKYIMMPPFGAKRRVRKGQFHCVESLTTGWHRRYPSKQLSNAQSFNSMDR